MVYFAQAAWAPSRPLRTPQSADVINAYCVAHRYRRISLHRCPRFKTYTIVRSVIIVASCKWKIIWSKKIIEELNILRLKMQELYVDHDRNYKLSLSKLPFLVAVLKWLQSFKSSLGSLKSYFQSWLVQCFVQNVIDVQYATESFLVNGLRNKGLMWDLKKSRQTILFNTIFMYIFHLHTHVVFF